MTTTQRVLQRLSLAVFLASAAFFLLTEHRAHLYGLWPFLLLLACLLLHVFGHGGHGGHGRHRSADDRSDGVGGPAGDAHAGHNLPRGRVS
jgi:hypothetical protein